MTGMKRKIAFVAVLAAMTIAVVPRATAQDGSIEFVARATPSGGLEEPVRGFPFYLLSKSFEEIGKEADAEDPKPDMTAFIEKLDAATYSPELKAWMKKNQFVTLAGEDFIRKVHPADVMDIPEFFSAYMNRNAGDQSADFPKSKVKAADKVKNPARYAKDTAEYTETIHHYIEQHPQSVDGIDLNLAEIDPGPKWNALLGRRTPEIHRRTLDLAQSKYLVARTESNLQGQGFLRDVPPGTYWISTLDVAADVGDARPRWDVPVTVKPGQTESVALSNVNSVRPSHDRLSH
jgi:hypothetical protein